MLFAFRKTNPANVNFVGHYIALKVGNIITTDTQVTVDLDHWELLTSTLKVNPKVTSPDLHLEDVIGEATVTIYPGPLYEVNLQLDEVLSDLSKNKALRVLSLYKSLVDYIKKPA